MKNQKRIDQVSTLMKPVMRKSVSGSRNSRRAVISSDRLSVSAMTPIKSDQTGRSRGALKKQSHAQISQREFISITLNGSCEFWIVIFKREEDFIQN